MNPCKKGVYFFTSATDSRFLRSPSGSHPPPIPQTVPSTRSASALPPNPLSPRRPIQNAPACHCSSQNSTRCALHPHEFVRRRSPGSSLQFRPGSISFPLFLFQSNDSSTLPDSPANSAARSCCSPRPTFFRHSTNCPQPIRAKSAPPLFPAPNSPKYL